MASAYKANKGKKVNITQSFSNIFWRLQKGYANKKQILDFFL